MPRIGQHLGLAQLGAALADGTGRHLALGRSDTDLWVLAWGRSAMPRSRASCAMIATLASKASRSRTRAGVSIASREPGRPIRLRS